jgi:hypothetical protein
MPIRQRITGEAARADVTRKNRGQHPLLRVGSLHRGLWEAIVHDGNPKGGITSAQLRAIYPNFHPQLLADLQKAKLVAKAGKIRSSFRYVADERGRGIIPQQVTVEVELYETETGALVTRTYLHGRKDEPGKPVRFLTSRKITIDVPGQYAPGVQEVAGDVTIDPEPDPYELVKAKKAKRDDNVIIEADTPDGPIAGYAPSNERWGLRALPYSPKEDDGCIIDAK